MGVSAIISPDMGVFLSLLKLCECVYVFLNTAVFFFAFYSVSDLKIIAGVLPCCVFSSS